MSTLFLGNENKKCVSGLYEVTVIVLCFDTKVHCDLVDEHINHKPHVARV